MDRNHNEIVQLQDEDQPIFVLVPEVVSSYSTYYAGYDTDDEYQFTGIWILVWKEEDTCEIIN